MKRSRIFTAVMWSVLLCQGACLAPEEDDNATGISQESFGGNLGNVIGALVVGNTTVGATNEHVPTCATSNAPDMSYAWTAPSSGLFTFTTIQNPPAPTFDTILQIREFNTGASLGCNDDSGGTRQSTVSVSLSIGQTVRIVVDGFGTLSGPFRLSISGSGGAVGRNYACGYALPGFGCNNGRASTAVIAADMTTAIAACRIAQPANLPDFCHVRDRDGFAPTNAEQCVAGGGSWRPGNNCCNFRGSTSCPS